MICEVNAARRAADRPALTPEPLLALAARRHARDMVRRGYFSHTTPGGRTMVDRLRAVGYLRGFWQAGEMLAWGTGDPGDTVDAWMRSRPHRRVLLGRRYRAIGVGIVDGTPPGEPGSTYAAELGSTQM